MNPFIPKPSDFIAPDALADLEPRSIPHPCPLRTSSPLFNLALPPQTQRIGLRPAFGHHRSTEKCHVIEECQFLGYETVSVPTSQTLLRLTQKKWNHGMALTWASGSQAVAMTALWAVGGRGCSSAP